SAPLLQRLLSVLPLAGRFFVPPLEPALLGLTAEGEPGTGTGTEEGAAEGHAGHGGAAPRLRGHAVICGFGRVGRELAEALSRRGLRYLVVEYNPLVVRRLRAEGVPVVYGDASRLAVLEHAHLEGARLLAVLMPNAIATEAATSHGRRLNPRLDIVARARDGRDVERLRRAGATEVVQPEFEASIEVVRHALRRYGVTSQELAHVTSGRRDAYYRRVARGGDDDEA
ncbi:MAG TPA: NAD(P)-binding protein, partial [Chloroflexota bacterium]|nr:NAD(P)-binding protein [Chloroflexota bacterium]